MIVHRSTETNADRVRITWTYQGHDGAQAVVERCDPLGCVVRAAASGQAPGQVSFEDEVQLGGTYTYRLGLPAGGRLHNSAPVHVVVPFAASIQLLSVSPNPTPGPIQVTFLLLSGAPATLALHDLQGRRVMSQPVSFPVVGRQSVTLDAPSDLGAGIYFVPCEHGGRTAARLIVLIR